MRGESMDKALLKTVGQIAGIGGLALGVVLLLFQAIIGKTANDSLLTTLAFLITLVGLAGIGAWVWVNRRAADAATPSHVIKGKVDASKGGVVINGDVAGNVGGSASPDPAPKKR
jgi:uncharacterized membrane protein